MVFGVTSTSSLNLIEYHQSGERPQYKRRVCETGLVLGVFKVKMPDRAGPLRRQLLCQRCFADLARAKQGYYRKIGQLIGKLIKMGLA